MGIKRSLGISFVTQYAELIINFVGVMILARIITSEEVGIYSVAAFLMALLHVFRDFGVAKYIISEDNLTPQKIRSALGVAAILAWAVALVLFVNRGPLSRFYDEPQIRDILTVMSVSFAVTPIGSVLIALFRREMQLKKVAIVRIGSTLIQTACTIVLALYGFGALSMAWSNLVGILAFGVIAALLRNPGTPLLPSFRKMREILRFGSVASLGSLMSTAGNNSPDVIIGKAISLEATGYFSRANGLVQIFSKLILGTVLPLVLPYFANLRREKGDIVKAYHLAIANLTALAWPFFVVMAIMAPTIVRTLYGPNWDTSIPLVRLLCMAGIVSVLASLANEVMIANGQIKTVTKLQLLSHPVRMLSILVASQFGLVQVAIAAILAETVTLSITSLFLYRTTRIGLVGVLRASMRSSVITACSVVGPVLVMNCIAERDHPLLVLAVGGIGAAAGWLLGVYLSGHPIKHHLQQAKTWFVTNAFPGH